MPRFSLPKFCRSSIQVIAIVKFGYTPIQNLLNFAQQTPMDFCKVHQIVHVRISLGNKFQLKLTILNFYQGNTKRVFPI